MNITPEVIAEIAEFSDRTNRQLREDPVQRTINIIAEMYENKERKDRFDKKLKELLPLELQEKLFSILVKSVGLLNAGIWPADDNAFMQEQREMYANPLFQKAVSEAYAFTDSGNESGMATSAPEPQRNDTVLIESPQGRLDNSAVALK